ncbi:unnamed protein product [Clavelina lepadiformis]|uniref:phosphoribosylaminoimidazolesuccinocarboxamide synthase n=1 Tax=Clavelina lepadiformis TaxID=159417 RepID=A0ABP0GT04_CLALP
MKTEFRIRSDTNETILSDVIEIYSWRIWPTGDKRLMMDKQVYRNFTKVTGNNMNNLKENYSWVSEKVNKVVESVTNKSGQEKAVVVMGKSKAYVPTSAYFCIYMLSALCFISAQIN